MRRRHLRAPASHYGASQTRNWTARRVGRAVNVLERRRNFGRGAQRELTRPRRRSLQITAWHRRGCAAPSRGGSPRSGGLGATCRQNASPPPAWRSSVTRERRRNEWRTPCVELAGGVPQGPHLGNPLQQQRPAFHALLHLFDLLLIFPPALALLLPEQGNRKQTEKKKFNPPPPTQKNPKLRGEGKHTGGLIRITLI